MTAPKPPAWRVFVAPLAASVVMVFVFVWLFGAALHQPQPHDVRVGVVGPTLAVEKVAAATEMNAPGAFTLSTYASADEARAAILERDIAGAVIVGSGQPRILVASAGGQAASGAISGAFTAMAEALGQSATVEDVLTLPQSDSRGLVPFFLVLGVSVSAFMFQLLYRIKAGPFRLRGGAVGMVVFAIVDGLLAALAVSIVIGFDAGYWSLAGVCALLALAVAAATAASLSLFGRAGVAIAGLVVILLGNASSGSILGSAFLPQPFRWLSPVLPAGAGLDAVRSVLYFEGAGLDWRLGTLALWVGGSLAVIAIVAAGKIWTRKPTPLPA